MTDLPRPRRVRADAVRNREQIVRATVDMLVELGPSVALETIARRAGVGIATLYRHFPDRKVLLRQVSIDMLRQSADAANAALAREPDAFSALATYLHTAIELRMGVIMPMLAGRVAGDGELSAARDESKQALEALVKAAHGEGSLRQDVGPGDINLLVIRMARPLPLPITADANRRLSHRHAELILSGLLHFLAGDPLPGPPLRVTELDPVPEGGDEPVWVDPGDYWQGGGTGVSPAHSAADTEGRSTKNGS
jgi:AcrR family transcriptional regulator